MDSESNLYRPVRIGGLELGGNIFLAPVAGWSDRAFRSLCAEQGADFAYTEMVSAEALTRGSGKTEALMRRAPNERRYAVQIFGGTEEVMAGAARLVLERTDADCIDINCGCPVPKIVKTGAGSALTRDPKRLGAVVRAVVAAVRSSPRPEVPVTVKIRSGWDAEHLTWREAAREAVDAGAAAVTLHARTRAQGYEGKADWDALAELVSLAADWTGGRVPVFGSGDAFTPQDARRMLETTGCAAVMFARGAMGNPFLFSRTRRFLQTGEDVEVPFEERIRAGFRELLLLVEDAGEQVACREARKRFCAYTKGAEGGAAMRKSIVAASSVADYRAVFAEWL